MNKIVFILLLKVLFISSILSQGYFNQWYFGHGAGIDFNNSSVTPKTNGAIFTDEGCASISDINGNLLFYTDGVTVWNKKHQPMFNGTGLKGHFSSTQSALIVPFRNNNHKYYIFTVSNNLSEGELRYSIINMDTDNGLGGIVSLKKNILLGTNFTEKLVSAKGSCGVWVLAHKRDNSDFHAYLIDDNHITGPIISSTGSPYYKYDYTGTMKVSPNDKKLAIATLNGIVELFDFNKNTGIISNPISFPIDITAGTYSLCFSPNSKLLYVGYGYDDQTLPNAVFQYDISSGIDTIMFKSKTFVANPISPNTKVFDIQIGPDDKLYIARPETKYIDIISSPNDIGLECKYISNAIDFGQIIIKPGLPNALKFPENSFDIDLGKDTTLCKSDTLNIDATIINSTYLWQDNSTKSKFTIKQAGKYWVEVSNTCGSAIDTINVEYTSIPHFDLGNDTTLCEGESLSLDIIYPDASFLWQDSSTNSFFTVDSLGKYWAKVSNYCGSNIDTIDVNYTSLPYFDLGNDTTLCNGESLSLEVSSPDATYLWQDSTTNSTITIDSSGKYWAKVSNICGSIYDTIAIDYISKPYFDLGNDTILCTGQNITLNISQSDAGYLWQDSSNNPILIVDSPGEYWAKATNSCGSSSDTINIDYTTSPNVFLGNDTTLCEGDALILDATTQYASYIWQDGSSNTLLTINKPGKYWVKVENNCGITFDTIDIEYKSKPLIELGNDTILCKGDNIFLDVTTEDATYLWQNNSKEPILTIDSSGVYYVKITNFCGSAFDTISIDFNSSPSINLGKDTSLCEGDKLILGPSIPNASYLWIDGSTDSIFIVKKSGEYWVKVENNCGSSYDTISIRYKAKPLIELGNDTTLCNGDNIILDVASKEGTYLWQDGSTNQSINVSQTGIYWIEINNCGINRDTIKVSFKDCDCSMYLPNIFTPNDDSVNDEFIPSSNCTFSEYRLKIFDRWGEKIFETNKYQNSWDGTFKNTLLPSGVYIYSIRYKYIDQEEYQTVYGDITLIR